MAMVAQRLLDPSSKPATTRFWHATTLAQELKVEDVDVNELYDALDWLAQRGTRAHPHLPMHAAYYVEWHMRKALSSVLFQDDELDAARWTRDPVAKAAIRFGQLNEPSPFQQHVFKLLQIGP